MKDFAEIPLTKGYIALVDVEDFEFINQFKWSASCRKDGQIYAERREKGILIRMHRFLLNAPRGMEVDHKNGNGLDNTRENLRLATRIQNSCNRAKSKLSRSGFKGVCLKTALRFKKYTAQISVNKKTIHLGYFDNPEEAARAYDEKAKELHGEFAVLNFPEVTPEEITIFGERKKSDEAIKQDIDDWQENVKAVGRYDDVMKEIGHLPDEQQFDAWVSRSGVKQVSSVRG